MNLTFNFIYSLIRDLDAKIFGSRSNGCVAEVPVLEGFMITLREGMEAFLIVGLSIAFLRKSGRFGLESAVHWGIATAVIVCGVAGILLYQVAFNQAFW